MSAGSNGGIPKVTGDLATLAPKFRELVLMALTGCRAKGLDAYVYEAYRTQELQALYYARGRTIVPPTKPITNAPSNLYSWHGYGLAVDVISRSRLWNAGDAWFAEVADVFQKVGCRWGGEWKMRDLPHFQWGRCKPSPSDAARALVASNEGLTAVWKAVGAV